MPGPRLGAHMFLFGPSTYERFPRFPRSVHGSLQKCDATSGGLRLLQRVFRAFIKGADFLMPQTALVDLDAGAQKLRLRQFLHREADSGRRVVEPAVFDLA